MKVLLLPSWYPNSDNELDGVFFKEQAEALSKRNIEVIVLSINIISLSKVNKTSLKSGLSVTIENNVKVYRYNTYNYFPRLTEMYLRYYANLIKKLVKRIVKQEGAIELVHIHSAIDAGIAYSISKIDIPYVITEHSSKYQRNLLNSVQKKYLKNVFNNAKDIIAVGLGLKNALAEYTNKDNIKVISNPISLKMIELQKEKDRNRFRFFSLGVLTKNKGMDLLIKAFYNNIESLKQCELYIGGDGPEYINIQNLIREYNLDDNIKLLGKLDREGVASNMNNCDAFVLASRVETFGIVFLEAMIYGKPVIGTRTGGPDTFIKESNGIIVDVENIKELGDALVEMYNEVTRYNEDDIIKYCYENFNEDIICKKIINVYKTAL